MGYNRIIHRTKTCSYCYGNHSVMDCEKLQEDKIKSETHLNNLSDVDPSHRRKIFELIIRRHSYFWDEEQDAWNLRPNEEYKNFTWELRRYIGVMEMPDMCEQTFKDIHSSLEPSLSQEQMESIMNDYRRMYPVRSHERIINDANSALESKQRRSNKRCSDCRETGHTAPTCSKKLSDKEAYRNAYKIAAYYTARACSRFGFWTCSMIKSGDGIKIWAHHFTKPENQLIPEIDVLKNTHHLTEDQIDFFYLTQLSDHKVYFNTPDSKNNRHHWGTSQRFVMGQNLKAFQSINWADNTLPSINMNSYGSSDGGSSDEIIFFSTKVSIEHIYNQIMSQYKDFELAKRSHENSTALRINDGVKVRAVLSEEEGTCAYTGYWTNYFGTGSSYLFDKKTRKKGTWKILHKFVENNQHILNKIDMLSV